MNLDKIFASVVTIIVVISMYTAFESIHRLASINMIKAVRR